jgi:glycosyltransferase involved in cell wall biosynthesis
MKIAMLGTRGIPASYSGFETCVEQLGARLVERGHRVSVYCRTHHITYLGDTYKGMRLIKIPTIANKYLDTIVHTFLSSLHVLSQGYDVGLYFISGNSPVSWIPRLVGTKTVINVDGLDWKREKWPALAKKYIQLAEFLATVLPNAIITDSHVVQDYYRTRYKKESTYIPYGSEIEELLPGETLAKLSLAPKKYLLFVGRLVPENCVHHLIEAFKRIDTSLKCVIVGGAYYADDYIAWLKEIAQDDPRILFPGYIFGDGYHELGSNAYLFVETSSVGGTHPALIEAMAFGNCVVVNDTPENLETIGDAGFVYEGKMGWESLLKVLKELVSDRALVDEYGRRARERVHQCYTWEAVTDAYERLFFEIRGASMPERLNDPQDSNTFVP